MNVFEEWNEFHDWEIRGMHLDGRHLELHVNFENTNKIIRFENVSRCYLKDFLTQNVISTIKLIDKIVSPALYADEEKSLLANIKNSTEYRYLAKISSSIGLDGTIEFMHVNVKDTGIM